MKYEDIIMSFDDLKQFVSSHNMKLECNIHHQMDDETMLSHIKDNLKTIQFKPMYYFGDTIESIRIEETIEGKLYVYYWSVVL